MSALAKYLLSFGFQVSGSDLRASVYTRELEELGATIVIGHHPEMLENVQMAVYSDAVRKDDPELKRAEELGLYILNRSGLLKSVAENFREVVGVGGCHGKTTVTCMLAHIYAAANEDFTAHIGGEDKTFSNCVIRGSKLFLTEVCEYKKNLLDIKCNAAVCLSADADHLDCYSSREELADCYYTYLKTADKAIINADDKILSAFADLNAVTFGLNKGLYTADNMKSEKGAYSFDFVKGGEKLCRIKLKVAGRHNAVNALAAAAVATETGIDIKYIKRGLKNFKGVRRRFEKVGKLNGADVIIDYAHHPREIEAALSTAREVYGDKFRAVFQPHTYSRTIFLKDEFIRVLSEIENPILYKTFPAREEFQPGGSALDLYKDTGERGKYFEDFDELIKYLKNGAESVEALLILGAGDLAELIREYLN